MVLTREARDTPGGLSALVLGPPPPSPARAPPSPYEGKRIDRLFAPVGPVCPSPKRAHKGGSLGRCPGEGEVPVPGGRGRSLPQRRRRRSTCLAFSRGV